MIFKDADAATNKHVAKAQLDGLNKLRAAGFKEGLVKWSSETGKGLDDFLLSLKGGANGRN